MSVYDRTELFGEAVSCYHTSCKVCSTFNIVACACRDFVKHNLFGNTPAEKNNNLFFHLRLASEAPVMLGERHCVAACHTSGYDGNLVYGILRLAVERADSVTCLVECRKALFVLAYNLRLLFGTCNHLDGSFLYIRLSDSLSVVSCRKQSRLVYKVCKVCACKSCRTLCYCSKAYIGSELFILCMNTQDSLSALDVGVADSNLSVKTSGTEQCGVENITSVGSRNNYYALIIRETVHLNE